MSGASASVQHPHAGFENLWLEAANTRLLAWEPARRLAEGDVQAASLPPYPPYPPAAAPPSAPSSSTHLK